MGKLEKEVKAEMRKTKVTKAIVDVIALTGTLAVAAVAPNVLGALGKMKFLNQRRYQVKSSFSKMIDAGYIVLEKKKNGTSYAKLTPKGERFANVMHEGKLVPQKPRHWDGKWRVLIFDVPVAKGGLRNKVRLTLTHIGFILLQRSVWIYPYDCEDLIVLLKADFKIGKELVYMIVDKVENDSFLRSRFGLPSPK